MEIKKIVSEEMDQNCYLISEGNKGFLIDPGMDTEKILKETENMEIDYVLLKHCHFDHIFSVPALGKKIIASKNCSDNMQNPEMMLFNRPVLDKPCDIIIYDGEEIELCGIKVKCICTPGHTNCGVCYLIGKNLFSGDTLFFSNIGRTDLQTGDFAVLEKSIKEKIYTLPGDIIVYPGHGRDTTVGFERDNNFYVKGQL